MGNISTIYLIEFNFTVIKKLYTFIQNQARAQKKIEGGL